MLSMFSVEYYILRTGVSAVLRIISCSAYSACSARDLEREEIRGQGSEVNVIITGDEERDESSLAEALRETEKRGIIAVTH